MTYVDIKHLVFVVLCYNPNNDKVGGYMKKAVFDKIVERFLRFSTTAPDLLDNKPITKSDAVKLFEECKRLFFFGGHALCAVDFEFPQDRAHPICGLLKRNYPHSPYSNKERHLRTYILGKNNELIRAIEITLGLRYLNYVSLDNKLIYYYQKEIPTCDFRGKSDVKHRLIKAIDKYLRLFPDSPCCADFEYIAGSLREKSYQKQLFDLLRMDDKILTKEVLWESRVRDRILADIAKITARGLKLSIDETKSL